MSVSYASQPIIYIDNLSKVYGHGFALQNVTFHVEKGERVGIFGPSGAGKTTIMRILSAYIPPSEGTITVTGYDVFTQSMEVRKRVGYLPQTLSLYEDMTVSNYLDFVASLYKIDDKQERVLAAIDRVDLAEYARTRIGKLCKNLQKRVGLAQAIIHNPDVLILDEPTYGLDPRFIIEMQSLIMSLSSEYTLLLSARTLAEAEQICDRVLMLNKGQIVAEDTPAHLTARLEGGQRIRLQTTSAPPDALNILQTLDGVSKVSVIGTDTFDIECTCSIDCRPVVANMVVQQGWGLLELHVVDASLEDVYLELTTNSVTALA